jgi:hypothetical protein
MNRMVREKDERFRVEEQARRLIDQTMDICTSPELYSGGESSERILVLSILRVFNISNPS